MSLVLPKGADGPEGVSHDDRLLRVLQSINHHLALLASDKERQLRAQVKADVLRAAGRVALWQAIDGSRSSAELAKAAGVSERFAQLFVNELLEMRLVRPVVRIAARGLVVEKDEVGVVEWYLGRSPVEGTPEQ